MVLTLWVAGCLHTPRTHTHGPDGIYDAERAAELGADAHAMRPYVVAFLTPGPTQDLPDEEVTKLGHAHMANIRRMESEGTLVFAGPFMDGGDIQGMYVFAVSSVEEARVLTSTDPAIEAGVLDMRLHPWYGSAALGWVPMLHNALVEQAHQTPQPLAPPPGDTPMPDEGLPPEAHHYLGVELNQQTWALLAQEDRGERDNKRMLHFAKGSLHHWQRSHKFEPVHAQRGHWLLSRVHAVLEQGTQSLEHAEQCLQLTDELALQDFDLAYAHEAKARAHAANGDRDEAAKHHALATDAGQAISGEKDKEYFLSDLAQAPWFGMTF